MSGQVVAPEGGTNAAAAATALGRLAVARTAPKQPTGGRWKRRIAYVILITYALLMFVPFGWSVITSFKTLPDSLNMGLPDPWTLQAWSDALTKLRPNVVVLFTNSLVIAGVVTISNLALGSLAGYAFARLRFPLSGLLFLLVLATLMIPDQLRLVPVYILFNSLGLTVGVGQYVAVILVMAISATSIFLMRQYFLTIPKDLEDAAKVDGAGFFTTFLRVMLPLATPALAAVAILQFQGTWNSFFWPVIFLKDQNHLTLPLGLAFFRLSGGYGSNWPPLMVVVIIATVPILLLYVFFQRYFVEGVAAAGVKG